MDYYKHQRDLLSKAIIDSASDKFGSAIERIQRDLSNQVVDLKNKGYNKEQILRILGAIDFEDYVLNTLNLQGDIEVLLNSYTSILEKMQGFGSVSEAGLQSLVDIDRTFYVGECKNFANTIKKELSRGIIAGLSENELRDSIFQGFGGILTKEQAKTIANTSLNSYSRSVTELMSENMPEDTEYYYQGALDDRTRDVCLSMISAGFLIKKEIESKYPSAFIDGGGYNCRHRWTMVTSTVRDSVKKANSIIDSKKSFKPVTARGVEI